MSWISRLFNFFAAPTKSPMKTFDQRTEAAIATLLPAAQAKAREFMAALEAAGISAKIICGTRTFAEQDALYARGRSNDGPKVTNARGGMSWHNYGIAFDLGIFSGSRYMEESPLYAKAGFIGKSLGLEWGGDWQSICDEPHFQLRTGLTLAECRERVARGESVV